jgi:hypothetical protein
MTTYLSIADYFTRLVKSRSLSRREIAMNRTNSLIRKIVFIGVCAAALGGCYYGPGPGYYAPGYYAAQPAYYGPPVYGEVVVGGGGGRHWR